jgi:hypothetical protein
LIAARTRITRQGGTEERFIQFLGNAITEIQAM